MFRQTPDACYARVTRGGARGTFSAREATPARVGNGPALAAGSTVVSREAYSLSVAATACRRCRACPLYLHATQSVFGEGPADAQLMLVGEQPGDEEDLSGHPFVGPAGALLDEALAAAGLDRSALYVTNAVKHFKFVERGKRRLHEKPNAREVRACTQIHSMIKIQIFHRQLYQT